MFNRSDLDRIMGEFASRVEAARAQAPAPTPFSTKVESEIITGEAAKRIWRDNPSPRRHLTRNPNSNAQEVQ